MPCKSDFRNSSENHDTQNAVLYNGNINIPNGRLTIIVIRCLFPPPEKKKGWNSVYFNLRARHKGSFATHERPRKVYLLWYVVINVCKNQRLDRPRALLYFVRCVHTTPFPTVRELTFSLRSANPGFDVFD